MIKLFFYLNLFTNPLWKYVQFYRNKNFLEKEKNLKHLAVNNFKFFYEIPIC